MRLDKLQPAGRIYGMSAMENEHLLVTKSRERGWRERLFSWPWCPWRKLHVWHEPDPDFYVMRGAFNRTETLIAHPATMQRLRDTLGALAK